MIGFLTMIVNPLTAWGCAELLFMLVRSRDIQIKNTNQRTAAENNQVARGLRRSLVLEALLFIPASTGLILLVLKPLLVGSGVAQKFGGDGYAFYGALGIISYGFPFVTVRNMITRVALATLKEFATLTPDGRASGTGGTR